ncbi:MAG: hypothetical protein AB9915_02970 [Candidatus Dojkabacteria bacterium]
MDPKDSALPTQELIKAEIKNSFEDIESLVPEESRDLKITYWYDETTARENDSLTIEMVKEWVVSDYGELLNSLGQIDVDALVNCICKREDPKYTRDSSFVRTEETPLSENEIELISQNDWNQHIERFEKESRRLSTEEIGQLGRILVDVGLMPTFSKIKKLNVEILPSKKVSGCKLSSLTIYNSTFQLDEGVLDEIEYPFSFSIHNSSGECEEKSFEEMFMYGNIDAGIIDRSECAPKKMQSSLEEKDDVLQIKNSLILLNESFESRRKRDFFRQADATFVKTIFEILKSRSLL